MTVGVGPSMIAGLALDSAIRPRRKSEQTFRGIAPSLGSRRPSDPSRGVFPFGSLAPFASSLGPVSETPFVDFCSLASFLLV